MIIAVFGSPGSGKTTVSMKLACEFAKMKKNVMVVTTDNMTPAMEILTKNEGRKSIGQALDMQSISEDVIIKSCNVTPNKYISVTGYAYGENEVSYTEITLEKGKAFFTAAKHVADDIIVDCTSSVLGNNLTGAALLSANKIIYVHGSDLKAVAFKQSNNELLTSKGILSEEYIPVMNNVRSNDPVDSLELRLGKMTVLVPACAEIYEQFIGMRLVDTVSDKAVNRAFEELADQIIRDNIEKDKESS